MRAPNPFLRRPGRQWLGKRTPCRQGQTHASAAEARRCDELHLMLQAGAISDLMAHPQPSWSLDVNGLHIGRYTADFSYETYTHEDGLRLVVEDVKGGPLKESQALRLKLVKALHGVDVRIIRKVRA